MAGTKHCRVLPFSALSGIFHSVSFSTKWTFILCPTDDPDTYTCTTGTNNTAIGNRAGCQHDGNKPETIKYHLLSTLMLNELQKQRSKFKILQRVMVDQAAQLDSLKQQNLAYEHEREKLANVGNWNLVLPSVDSSPPSMKIDYHNLREGCDSGELELSCDIAQINLSAFELGTLKQ